MDTSRPNAGRMYDYWLGGSHNFEIDRQAAERVKASFPFISTMARLQRWCLRDLAVELTQQRGFDVIIDFASGLPTDSHIHHKAARLPRYWYGEDQKLMSGEDIRAWGKSGGGYGDYLIK